MLAECSNACCVHSMSISRFGWTVESVVRFVVENAESFLEDVGAVSPPTKQGRILNSCIRSQVYSRLEYSRKKGVVWFVGV